MVNYDDQDPTYQMGGNPGEGGSGMLRDNPFGASNTVPEGFTYTKLTIIRPSWDDYFMEIARAVARRGDCRRRQVGCVLVDAEHRIIGTGYNGAEPGGPSCLAGQCPRGRSDAPRTEDYSNCVAIHAEANALLFSRVSARGATAYVSSPVCDGCRKLLRGAGVVRVVQLDLTGAMF